MSEITIKDVIVDDFVYARDEKSKQNTEILVEKLKAGIKLESIEIQRVSGYNETEEEVVLLLNGGHRLDAYEIFNKLESFEAVLPEFAFYKDEVLNYQAYKSEFAIHSHNINDKQGLNSRPGDTKKIARNLKLANPDWTEKEIADKLHRVKGTISPYIKDIVQAQRASEKCITMRLSRLGWTQTEIGEVIGKDRSVVSRIVQRFDTELLHNSFSQGKSVEEIASFSDLDIQTVWSILLQNKSDEERLMTLEIEPKKYTVWNFSSCHKLMGQDSFEGRIPGEIPLNFLYYFTKPKDLVVDPMAGSGPTVDAALLLGRKCKTYDLTPQRPEIEENDILNGYPKKLENVDAVFCNPPYWCSVDYGEGLSSLSLDEFYKAMEQFIKETFSILKSGGYFGIIMANQSTRIPIEQKRLPEDSGHRLEHILKMYNYCTRAGFQPWWRIICPLSTQGAQDWAQGEWDLGRLGEINREFLIFKK